METKAVKLAAVKHYGWAIEYINNPSEAVKAIHLALWEL
jgi:hypothetical protein